MSESASATGAGLSQPFTNVTIDDFLTSLCIAEPCPYSAAESQTLNQDLQQFVTHHSLLPFRPAVVATAQNLDELTHPVSSAKVYFGFQIFQSVVLSYTQYGNNAVILSKLISDMLEELLKGDELDTMKYCRLRHLGERHLLVMETFVNSLQAAVVKEDFSDLMIVRKGVRGEVTILEALYIQALAADFIDWMGSMGMILH